MLIMSPNNTQEIGVISSNKQKAGHYIVNRPLIKCEVQD